MRVLVSEAAAGDAVEAIGRLRAAGHTVRTCHGGDRCPLALGEPCPLVDDGVDVVVHVRARPAPLGEHDRPFLCGVIADIPVVLCGYTGPDGPWSRADAHCSPTGVVAAVEKAAAPTSRTAHRRVARAVAEVLRAYDLPGPSRVTISASHGVVDVGLALPRPVPVAVREQLRAAVRGALATLTPHWAYARLALVEDRELSPH